VSTRQSSESNRSDGTDGCAIRCFQAGAQVQAQAEDAVTGFIWIAVIGLIAGVIARFLLPGPNNPQGFVVTALLGIAGAFVATWLGQSIGWYRHDQGAGLIGATLGALVVLFIWHRLVVQRAVTDPGVSASDRSPPST
jgi:uncharacterized membrane protein YeaQ/YmgE (transglycosylase-associated protein family)